MNAFVYGTLMTSEIFNKVVFGTLTTDYKLKRSKAVLKVLINIYSLFY
jgi:hypothetical protein